MLRSLHIRNLATIEEIDLELDEGFSILTGETGAGKSIIIDGVRLLIGGKSSADMIRTGENKVTVEGIFSGADDRLIQRVLSDKGGNKGYFDGTLVPIRTLRERGECLVDIFGQNDHVFLRNTENQLDYLDAYAEALSQRAELAETARVLRKKIKQKRNLDEKKKDRAQRIDFLQFQIREIEEAGLTQDEEERLTHDRHILKNAEKIQTLVNNALDLVHDDEKAVLAQISRLQTLIEELSDYEASLSEVLTSLDQFVITMKDLSGFLVSFKEKQDLSANNLETVEERLSQIEKLKRKYGQNIGEILAHLSEIRTELDMLSSSQEKTEALTNEIQEAFQKYRTQAERLYRIRKEKAALLEKEIEKEIQFLGMNKSRVRIELQTSLPELSLEDKFSSSGTEDVEFLISPNPGEDPKPLRRIASGGELSRIMLALKSIGRDAAEKRTLIFDEIDAGIGGKVADFVALKLKKLSENNQVLCITHLPQIASSAVHHFKIDKSVQDNRTYTTVKKLEFDERVQEIARLISGSRVTDTTLQNAREMLLSHLPEDVSEPARE